MSQVVLNVSRLNAELLEFYAEGPERGGFIPKDGTIVELSNTSEDTESFQPDASEVIKHCDDALATWHTHPGASANLSVGDWESFIEWPALYHVIVGQNGEVRWYEIKRGGVVNLSREEVTYQ
jgi:proteasome lid subunit RPN8/RPN11